MTRQEILAEERTIIGLIDGLVTCLRLSCHREADVGAFRQLKLLCVLTWAVDRRIHRFAGDRLDLLRHWQEQVCSLDSYLTSPVSRWMWRRCQSKIKRGVRKVFKVRLSQDGEKVNSSVVGPVSQGTGADYPDRTFLVIRRQDASAGLFSHYMTALGWMKYAEEHGMTPVVDMRSTENAYRNQAGDFNPWERFFCQSGGVTLQALENARNVCFSSDLPPERPDDSVESLMTMAPSLWHAVAMRHCPVLPCLIEEAKREETELWGVGKRKILGVLLRGTDYVAMRPPGHPVQPDIKRALEETERKMAEWGCEGVFLVSEDDSFVRCFQEKFGDRVKILSQTPIRYEGYGYLCDAGGVSGNLKLAREYVLRIVLLSRCQALLAGRASGSVAATILSGGNYQKSYYWDLGRYPWPQ